MKNPRGYIIYLKNHENSVEWANHALVTGKKLRSADATSNSFAI